ncbi:hypothetical protein [Oryzifoliimicrobium ureilyticus]|uniref:hypothetical protein n=1 Tax=Oryzifoliimicrobium ureilyticus TaxID=3113724 RepID=UPI0030767222
MASDDPIRLVYNPDEAQIPDTTLGVVHQLYQNFKMTHSTKWEAWYENRIQVETLTAAWVGAFVFLGTFIAIRSWWDSIFVVLITTPFAALAMYFTAVRYGRARQSAFSAKFVEYQVKFDKEFNKSIEVELSSAGFRQTTTTHSCTLSWIECHLALTQPEHLVLVFQTAVVAIPNHLLPYPPKEITELILRWTDQTMEELNKKKTQEESTEHDRGPVSEKASDTSE